MAPTPGTVSSRSLIRFRAISVTSRKSRLPEMAIVITGIDPVSNLSMIGGWVPSGRSDRIVLTLSRTSCVPTSPFLESRNWTVTIETPSWVIDRSSSIPETVLMMSSTRLGDGRLHLLDAGPRQHRGDRADRKVDVGKQVDPELVVRRPAPAPPGSPRAPR